MRSWATWLSSKVNGESIVDTPFDAWIPAITKPPPSVVVAEGPTKLVFEDPLFWHSASASGETGSAPLKSYTCSSWKPNREPPVGVTVIVRAVTPGAAPTACHSCVLSLSAVFVQPFEAAPGPCTQVLFLLSTTFVTRLAPPPPLSNTRRLPTEVEASVQVIDGVAVFPQVVKVLREITLPVLRVPQVAPEQPAPVRR